MRTNYKTPEQIIRGILIGEADRNALGADKLEKKVVKASIKDSVNDSVSAMELKGGKTKVIINPETNDSPEETDNETKKSKQATNSENKKIGVKTTGVKEETMSNKLTFGLPEGLINSVRELIDERKTDVYKAMKDRYDDKYNKKKSEEKPKDKPIGKKTDVKESEELDEISKDTLGRYIHAAHHDAMNQQDNAKVFARMGGDAQKDGDEEGKKKWYRKAGELSLKKANRDMGIHKAVQKLTGRAKVNAEEVEFSPEELAHIEEVKKNFNIEEVENIAEISDDKLGNYIKNASRDIEKRSAERVKHLEKVKEYKKSSEPFRRFAAANKADNEASKLVKRHKGINNAIYKILTRE